MVDDVVFEMIGDIRWYQHVYVQGTIWVRNKPRGLLLHRVIMDAPPGVEVDHIDGDRLNNQISNLRLCSHAENQRNRSFLNKNNTTGFKGVYLNKDNNTYYAQITVFGKHRTIASGFKNKEDAAKAYDAASVAEHGDFSKTNRQLTARCPS